MAAAVDQTSFLSFLTESTTITSSDFPLILLSAVVYGIYRLILTKLLLEPLSKLVTNADPEKQRSQRYRFIHRGFDLIHYTLGVFVGILAGYFLPYGRCPFFFPGCAPYAVQTRPVFICSRLEKAYYLLFVAYYISDIPFIGTTREIPLLVFHHAVCLSLEILAVLAGRPVITFSCNLLHDIVDIFLYAGKILTYLGFKRAAEISLILFAAAYLWFRLINFGLVIYTFWFVDVGEQVGYEKAYKACKWLVFGLLFCHVIWFGKILGVIFDALNLGMRRIRDVRSDEGEKKAKAE
jgi:hypothetical protein